MTQRLSIHEPSIVEWLQLIRAEYLEIPGLHLTDDRSNASGGSIR